MAQRGALSLGLLIGLLSLSGGVQAATAPTVVVVAGDLVGAGGSAARRLGRERASAVVQALQAAGIPCQQTTDTEVQSRGLPDVPVAILPYSRAISDEELYHLRAFLNRPAHLIVFFTTRGELADELSVGLGPVIKETSPGQFYSLDCTPGGVPGLPATVRQDATMIREVSPVGDAQVLGRWRTVGGRFSPYAGLVLSDKGAFIGGPPQNEQKPETARLLRALVGHFAPKLWDALATTDPAEIGPAGRYKSLAEMEAALRTNPADYLAGARADVNEALELLASIPDLLARGKQDAALQAPHRAQRLAQRAWWRAYPSPSPEVRGVWACDTVAGGWEQALRSLKEANFNAVFPYVASGAAAYYPSSVLPECRDGVTGDPVAEMARWGKECGVQVHPRVLGLFTMGAPDEVRAALARPKARIATGCARRTTRTACASSRP